MTLALKTNLKKLMIKHGNISVSDLAKATTLPQPTLYQLYTGVTENPRKKTLKILADYFSISVNQLTGEEDLPNHLPKKIKEQLELNTAPLLSWPDLHDWPHHINLNNKEDIFLGKKANQTTFAIQMIGRSMEPIFPNGCLLIFDAEKKAKDKDCAIIFIQETNQFFFKKIVLKNDLTHVQSLNPGPEDIKTIQLTQQDKIIATLLEARLTF